MIDFWKLSKSMNGFKDLITFVVFDLYFPSLIRVSDLFLFDSTLSQILLIFSKSNLLGPFPSVGLGLQGKKVTI